MAKDDTTKGPRMKCTKCLGSGWVDEDHPGCHRIVSDGGCVCGGAAVPCKCNPGAEVEGVAIIATTEPGASFVTEWVH
ncbi:MAG: hypothetical protein EOP82_30345 [Variovorax sp.]|nr:MAG: hypothetical protein EOP82_30345 [Variovorax sp.]